MFNYFIIETTTNKVKDIVIWDGDLDNWQPPSGHYAIIDSGGRVTKPQLPFFHAEAFTTSGITSQTGVLSFNSVITNQGSHWNSSQNRFEVPVNGVYQFNFNG